MFVERFSPSQRYGASGGEKLTLAYRKLLADGELIPDAAQQGALDVFPGSGKWPRTPVYRQKSREFSVLVSFFTN